MLKTIFILFSVLLFSFSGFTEQISNECLVARNKLIRDYRSIQTSLDQVENNIFNSLGSDFESDFRQMEQVGCRTNATEKQVSDLLNAFEEKYSTQLNEHSFESWDVSIAYVRSANSTVEREAAMMEALENGTNPPVWNAGTQAIRITREITNSNGQRVQISRLLDPCVSDRNYLVLPEIPENLRTDRLSDRVSIEGEEDIEYKLLPLQCVSNEGSRTVREMLGHTGPKISELHFASHFFNLPKGTFSTHVNLEQNKTRNSVSSQALD